MGRADLIGPGKHQLVPRPVSPPAPVKSGGEGKRLGAQAQPQKFLTKGVGMGTSRIADPGRGNRDHSGRDRANKIGGS